MGLHKIIIQYKTGQKAITYTQTKGVKCRVGQVHVGSLLQLKMWYEQLIAILLKNGPRNSWNAVLGRGVPCCAISLHMKVS